MNLQLKRYSDNGESTLGLLCIEKKFQCYTVEDTFRQEKIPGKTRIPAGRYQVVLRKEGRMHTRYTKTFPTLHKGMLWLKDVPGFEWILIHIGNHAGNTDGCILVGDTANNNTKKKGVVSTSKDAYATVYPKIVKAIELKKKVWIDVIDPA